MPVKLHSTLTILNNPIEVSASYERKDEICKTSQTTTQRASIPAII